MGKMVINHGKNMENVLKMVINYEIIGPKVSESNFN